MQNRRIVAGIIFAAVALSLASSQGDSLAVDEVPHIGAGYSYIKSLEYRLNPEHPPLIKDLAGIAISWLSFTNAPFNIPDWTGAVNGQWNFGRTLIFNSGINPDLVKTLARLPMFCVFILLAWFIWKWTRERYGNRAGIIALILFSFSPTVLAHNRLVATDMGAAAGVVFATYFFVKFLRNQKPKTFWIAVLALGLALLTKFSMILLGPYFILIATIHEIRQKSTKQIIFQSIGKTILLGIMAVCLVVWPFYVIHTANYSVQQQMHDATGILSTHSDGFLKSTILWISDKPILRPFGQWLLGISMVMQRAMGNSVIYWMGDIVPNGGPLYFPIVYLLKEPLIWWVFVAIVIVGFIFHRKSDIRNPKSDDWIWATWILLYWIVSIESSLNIGIRHLLPVYPFTIMLVSGRVAQYKSRIATAIISTLLLLYVACAFFAWPNYLSYFNKIVGGSSGGYRYVVDSNLDWGQDGKRFGKWVISQNIPCVSTDYFGWADLSAYAGNRIVWTSSSQWEDRADFIKRNQCDGWLAVSTTFFQNSIGQKEHEINGERNWRWLLNEKPITTIGNSIFVWQIKRTP